MIFIMAWRNIWRNKMRSIVIMLSVSIGLFAGIAVLALYKGMMRSRVRTVIDAEISHIQIHQKEFKKDYPNSTAILLYGGKEKILINDIICIPIEAFLLTLRPGEKL